MITRWLRASRITTEDHVVSGGESNPLQPGGKRRAWKVAEVMTDGRTTLRLVCRGGAAGGGDAWITQTLENGTKLRVLER